MAPLLGKRNFGHPFNGNDCCDSLSKKQSAGDVVPIAFVHTVQIYIYAMHVLRSGRKDKAMKVFVLNQKHPDDKFWTSLGLARGYTAVGDKTNAIANWEIVVRNVPASLKAQTANYQRALKKLKETS